MMPHVLHCWIETYEGRQYVALQRGADSERYAYMVPEDFMDLFGFLPGEGKQVPIPFGPAGRPKPLHEEEAA